MLQYVKIPYCGVLQKAARSILAEGIMSKRAISVIYVVNIVAQAIFTLLWQIGLGLLAAWAAVKYLSAPTWIYAPLVLLGVLTGFWSMIRFILSAMSSLERLEAQHARDEKQKKASEGEVSDNTDE